jgi:hypothetical protein
MDESHAATLATLAAGRAETIGRIGMRTLLVSVLVSLGFLTSAAAVPRQSVVTMFDAVQFVDGPNQQSVETVIPRKSSVMSRW